MTPSMIRKVSIPLFNNVSLLDVIGENLEAGLCSNDSILLVSFWIRVTPNHVAALNRSTPSLNLSLLP